MKFRWLAALIVAALSFAFPAAGLAASSGSPTITLTAQSGLPGTPLTISGTGFPPLEVVALYIDSPGPFLGNPPPGPQADAQGAFQQSIIWPDKNYDLTGKVNPAKAGPHDVCGDTTFQGSTQAIAAKACAQFTVNTIATPASAPGVPIALAVGGFVILIVLGAVAVTRLRSSDQAKP